MAPEVVRHDSYSFEADLWSLGVLIFELLCGYTPFATSDALTGVLTYNNILTGSFSWPFPKWVTPRARGMLCGGRLHSGL